MALLLGYNTNGFPSHRLTDVLWILSEIGYRSVGLTVDAHHPPRGTSYEDLGHRLRELGLLPVIETGARFVLDPWRKHRPTLMDADRSSRIAFLLASVRNAAAVGAPCVSLWSGAGDDWDLLVDGLRSVCDLADEYDVDVAFEPEPGHLVDTMARFAELRRRLPHPRLGLTLDVGHLWCLEDGLPEEWIDRYADLLRNVHLDDHCRGVHEHLFFGEGQIDWPPVMDALRRAAKQRDIPATVELPRHAHDAVETARRAFGFLSSL